MRMTKSKKQSPTFKLGNLEIPFIEIGGEAVAITATGVYVYRHKLSLWGL